MTKQAIRFSVLSKEGMRSATWICFSAKEKNDFYLACREFKGAMKVSFHESGRFRIAFDKTFLERKAPENSSLLIDRSPIKWSEPNKFCPGVILAFRIIVPEWVVTIPIKNAEKALIWIPAPPKGLAIEIAIFLTYQEATVSSWPGAELMKTALIGKIDLLNKRTVWIVYRVIELPPLKFPTGGRPIFFGRSSMEDLKKEGVRGILIGVNSDGSAYFFENTIKKIEKA